MKKSRLLGIFSACVIAFVCASVNAAQYVVQNTNNDDLSDHSVVIGTSLTNHKRNDSLSSGLLNTVIIISCGLIGLFLLRKANLYPTLIKRQTSSRRSDRVVEFPLTNSQELFVVKDRRQLSDRRKAEHGIKDLRAIFSKLTGKKAA